MPDAEYRTIPYYYFQLWDQLYGGSSDMCWTNDEYLVKHWSAIYFDEHSCFNLAGAHQANGLCPVLMNMKHHCPVDFFLRDVHGNWYCFDAERLNVCSFPEGTSNEEICLELGRGWPFMYMMQDNEGALRPTEGDTEVARRELVIAATAA